MRYWQFVLTGTLTFGLLAACGTAEQRTTQDTPPVMFQPTEVLPDNVQNPEDPAANPADPAQAETPAAAGQDPVVEEPSPVGAETPGPGPIIAEEPEYGNDVPVGQNGEGEGNGEGQPGDEEPAHSGDMDLPGVFEPGVGGNADEIPNDGWEPASTPDVWTKVPMAPYPNTLPQAPVALNNPNYMPWTAGRSLAVHDGSVFVVSTEADALVVLDQATGLVQRMIHVGSRPEQVLVAPDGTAYVTVRFSGKVVSIPAGSSQIAKVASVGTEPYGIALSPNAKTLYVTISGDNRVIALRAQDLAPISNMAVARRPRSIAAHPDGSVYVGIQFGKAVKFNTSYLTGALTSPVELALRTQNPADLALHESVKLDKALATRVFGMTVSPADDNRIYISHVNVSPGSPEQSMTELVGQVAETETACETQCKQTCKNSGGYGGTVCANSCNTDCTTTVTTFPHIIRPLEPTVTAYDPGEEQHNAVESAAPVMHAISGEPMTAICDKPIDANHHPTHSLLFVVCRGTDNVLVLNTHDNDPMRSTIGELKVGNQPMAISFSPDGLKAYVRNSTSFTVSEVDLGAFLSMSTLNANQAPAPGFGFGQHNTQPLTKPVTLVHNAEVAYGLDNVAEEQRTGRRVFHFARFPGLAQNGFFACSTCHMEGTDDGLVWFVKDGPRQTPLIAQRLKGSEPFNWVGTAADVNTNIENTVTRMGGSGLLETEVQSLSDFLFDDHALPLPPNPNLAATGLTQSQMNGKLLFYHPSLGCADCHAGKHTTDGENWDVGTFTDLEVDIHGLNGSDPLSLNTPSLKGLYYSEPYLHDGSAKDLYDVLNMTSATMGVTVSLTGQQQLDLVNYLLTL